MKLHSQTKKQLQEALETGLAFPASWWTTGTGKHTAKRSIPYFYREIKPCEVDELKGEAKKEAKKVMREYPKTRKLVVCVDLRGARAASKS